MVKKALFVWLPRGQIKSLWTSKKIGFIFPMSSKAGHNGYAVDKKCGFLRILIPSAAVGALIGCQGRTITELQKDTETKIEISHRNDYYPGTTERICLVSGFKEGIYRVVEVIVEVVNKNPFVESSPCMHYYKKILYGRRQQVKILIPDDLAVRMIKPKKRAIKEIELRSGSYVRLLPVSHENDCERCITVVGDEEDNLIACLMLIDRIINYQNMNQSYQDSYSHERNRILGLHRRGSPYIGSQNLHEQLATCGHELPTGKPPFNMSRTVPDGPYPVLPTVSTNAVTIDWDHFLRILQIMLANSRLPTEAVISIINALCTLNSYGVLDLCLQILINDLPPPGGNPLVYPFHPQNVEYYAEPVP